ncbi:Rieske (2Fe-2S) protein [Aporhodopirellula aestuarii]|uniref:Rieske (2Fe-2S) protein n=1 Tax=Aporhodopirellula aestuarii TaxID=2950107 RepID=A0ABT0U3V8_9BACT|nr:Rieske (2Fe-2S) protein [Aporhodopirellula aestuarii]MCM2371599.1 Rieske (2Fe-2S) protein [Aporhodopirellula aestuarii]
MSDTDHVPRYPNDAVAHTNKSSDEAARRWRVAIEIGDQGSGTEKTSVKTVSAEKIESGEDFAIETLIDDRVLAIFRHAGKWYAIDGMCSHQGGPLAEGVVRDGCVTCPWHGWQYDLATGIQMINRQPLQESFPIRQIENRVEVSLH